MRSSCNSSFNSIFYAYVGAIHREGRVHQDPQEEGEAAGGSRGSCLREIPRQGLQDTRQGDEYSH